MQQARGGRDQFRIFPKPSRPSSPCSIETIDEIERNYKHAPGGSGNPPPAPPDDPRNMCSGGKKISNATNRLVMNKVLGKAYLLGRKKQNVFSKTILKLILDSGCTWHATYRREHLINFKSTDEMLKAQISSKAEVLVGINGVECHVTGIGDMPVYCRDKDQKLHVVLIRNVRLVESFTEILISVDQLWEESRVEARFADHRSIYLNSGVTTIALPFIRAEGLFIWPCGPAAEHVTDKKVSIGHALMSTTAHKPKTTAHISRLPADDAATALHLRLNLPPSSIRRLSTMTSDVPESVAKGTADASGFLTEANAKRIEHTESLYKPTYTGRLIHGDIAGPFKRSHCYGYQYMLVLTDDHSRLRAVYFLNSKSEALQKVRSYVAALNALISRNSDAPKYAIGSLHTDNAGEFLSREFKEFLDESLIKQTTCPPYVHALNGVAERSIQMIMDHVRSSLVASNAPISFWPYAAEHAVDILNRVMGPPGSKKSSYEIATGIVPKVMSIMPFGCRAYAIKPPVELAKTVIPSKAWRGMNLGRVPDVPGAYHIWIPEHQKVAIISDVYFSETIMPWRPVGDQRIGTPLPTSAAVDALPSNALALGNGIPAEAPVNAQAETLTEAYAEATGRPLQSSNSKKILLLFGGPKSRPTGLDTFLIQMGFEVELFDILDGESDISDDAIYQQLHDRITAGEFFAIFAAPPCSTVSVSRFIVSPTASDGGAPIVRNRQNRMVMPNASDAERREAEAANLIFERTAALLLAAWLAGTHWSLENPADRGDPMRTKLFMTKQHCPIFLLDMFIELSKRTGAEQVTFPMCAFGSEWQKYTTLLFSPGFSTWFRPLAKLMCSHKVHGATAGGIKDDVSGWNSHAASAYPPAFNYFIARGIANLQRVDSDVPIPLVGQQDQPTLGGAESALVADASAGPLESAEPLQEEGIMHGPKDLHPIFRGPFVDTPGVEKAHWLANGLPPTPAARSPVPRFSPVAPLHLPQAASPVRAPAVTAPVRRPKSATIAPLEPVSSRLRSKDDSTGSAAMARGGLNSALKSVHEKHPLGSARGFALFTGPRSSLVLPPVGRPRALLARAALADPKNYAEAMAEDEREGNHEWRDGCLKELRSHASNESFEVRPASEKPRGRAFVKFTWVFKRKRDGTKKCRLCVQGCTQRAGVDYDQTYCGSMRSTSLRKPRGRTRLQPQAVGLHHSLPPG